MTNAQLDPLIESVVTPNICTLQRELEGLRFDPLLHHNVLDWMADLNIDGRLPGLIEIHRLYSQLLQAQANLRIEGHIHFDDFVAMLVEQMGMPRRRKISDAAVGTQ